MKALLFPIENSDVLIISKDIMLISEKVLTAFQYELRKFLRSHVFNVGPATSFQLKEIVSKQLNNKEIDCASLKNQSMRINKCFASIKSSKYIMRTCTTEKPWTTSEVLCGTQFLRQWVYLDYELQCVKELVCSGSRRNNLYF